MVHLVYAFEYFNYIFNGFQKTFFFSLNKIKNPSYREKLIKLGKEAAEHNLSNAIQVMWEFHDEPKLKFYQEYYSIVEENKSGKSTDLKKTSTSMSITKKKSRITDLKFVNNPKSMQTDMSDNDMNIDELKKKQEELGKRLLLKIRKHEPK